MRGAVELPPARSWSPLIQLSLEEDLGSGDVTSRIVVPEGAAGAAVIEARQDLVVCGLEVAASVMRAVDPSLAYRAAAREGQLAEAGQPLARVHGSLRSILAAERTALNFLMRLCGVATLTSRFVASVEGTGAHIVDTRKTIPGWRLLDKYATAVGGADNHRVGLYDGILLKDNHVAAAGGVALAVKAALAAAPANLRVQVEVESERDAVAAVEAGADFLLLDNCELGEMRAISERLGGRALLEVSGGVRLENVRAIAETGVQRISIGALTHSAPGADVALELVGAAREGADLTGGVEG